MTNPPPWSIVRSVHGGSFTVPVLSLSSAVTGVLIVNYGLSHGESTGALSKQSACDVSQKVTEG